jgi:hypothetical protein
MRFAAKPGILMSYRFDLRNMNGTVMARHHVLVFQFCFWLFTGIYSGFHIIDEPPDKPDNQSKNDESDEAHKSLYNG